jgi:drug/metabolite transporter (DMT)-like permease
VSVLFGFLTAVMWAVSTLASSRSVRSAAQTAVVAWVMLVGLVETAPLVVAIGVPASLDARAAGWLAVAGVGNVLGLLLTYAGLRVGKVGIVAPIVAAEGAVAAVISALLGEQLSLPTALALAVVALGVVVSAIAPDPEAVTAAKRTTHPLRGALLATCAASVFGVSLFASGHLSNTLPAPWILLGPRLVGVVALTLPLAARRQLAVPRSVLPLVVISGTAEVLGFFAYTLGARHGVAVTSVIASQFAPLAALAAFVLFRERLSRVQVAGVVLLVAGISAISLVSAAG